MQNFKTAIYGGASTIVTKLNEKVLSGDKSWELVNITKDPEYYSQNYEVRHNGEPIIQISRLHGFGFGSNAWYPHLNKFQFKKLEELGVPIEIQFNYRGKSMEEIRAEIRAIHEILERE